MCGDDATVKKPCKYYIQRHLQYYYNSCTHATTECAMKSEIHTIITIVWTFTGKSTCSFVAFALFVCVTLTACDSLVTCVLWWDSHLSTEHLEKWGRELITNAEFCIRSFHNLMPRPHPLTKERIWVTTECFLVVLSEQSSHLNWPRVTCLHNIALF